jgi:ABC-2 type transport system ATP-binding protein
MHRRRCDRLAGGLTRRKDMSTHTIRAISQSQAELREPVIEVAGLSKTYPGGVTALDGIDFEVSAGEVFGLLGPNGAGKSTTVGILTTTIAPTAGRARLAGVDVFRQPIPARRASSVVFQEAVVDRGLSGRKHLELHARLWGVPSARARPRIGELIDALDLGSLADRPVGSYSGGERRRLEIARALVSRPRVLFLDEPTVGLDPRIRHELLDLIAAIRAREEMTVLLTTHYLDEAQRLCDRVAIINRGRIAALDSPQALLAGIGDEVLELEVGADTTAALAALHAGESTWSAAFAVGTTLVVPLGQTTVGDVVASLDDAGISARSISSRHPTLDDVYLQQTGARLADAV